MLTEANFSPRLPRFRDSIAISHRRAGRVHGPIPVPKAAAGLRAAVAFVVLTLAARAAGAAQFVVADATYTHSAQTTTDSHYRVPPLPGTPTNWVAPINYSTGSAHVRLEVKTKPNTTTPTTFQVCFEATQNYGCTDISRPYTTTGLYEWDTPFSRFFTPGPVPWDRGIVTVAILLKDTMNVKPAPENVGAATSALYMPTDVHVTVTIVSVGSVFQPPPGTQPPDAGLADAAAISDGGAAGGDSQGSRTPDAGQADVVSGGGGGGGTTAPPGTGGTIGTSVDAAVPVSGTGGAAPAGTGGRAAGSGNPPATGGAMGTGGGGAAGKGAEIGGSGGCACAASGSRRTTGLADATIILACALIALGRRRLRRYRRRLPEN